MAGASTGARRCARPLAVGATALAIVGCGGVTDLDPEACPVVPNPGIPVASGFEPRAAAGLQSGEACAVRTQGRGAVRLLETSGASEYLVGVQSASEVAAASTSLRLTLSGSSAIATQLAARASTGSGAASSWASDAELRFRRAARRLLRDTAIPARPGRPAGPTLARIATTPERGDTLTLRIAVDAALAVDCRRTEVATAVVRAVGRHFAIIEDVSVAGVLADADYAGVLSDLEDPIFTVGESYFGSPADLDGNGRVLAFVTPIVNRATPPGSSTFVAGFFSPIDLADVESCAASNAGEILYLLAPDPDGEFGDPVGPVFATRNARGVSAHELAHLLIAQQRITLGGGTFADLEESWLDEGLAHTAETAVGFAAAGFVPGRNYGYGELANDRETFRTYHVANLRRAGFYMENPAGTLALGDSDGNDPGGTRSLEMRGFAWLFLRWIADQSDLPAGGILGAGDEDALFRDLAAGGPTRARGTANVLRAAGPRLGVERWRDLLARYGLAPLADDRDGNPTPDSQVTSLDLPDVYAALDEEAQGQETVQGSYPLMIDTFELDGAGRDIRFDVLASTTRYFVLTSATGHGPVDLTLTTGTGDAITSASRSQIVIQRIR